MYANQLHVSQTCQLHPHSILNNQDTETDIWKKIKDLWQNTNEWITELNKWPSHGKEGNDILIWIGRVSPRFRSTDSIN